MKPLRAAAFRHGDVGKAPQLYSRRGFWLRSYRLRPSGHRLLWRICSPGRFRRQFMWHPSGWTSWKDQTGKVNPRGEVLHVGERNTPRMWLCSAPRSGAWGQGRKGRDPVPEQPICLRREGPRCGQLFLFSDLTEQVLNNRGFCRVDNSKEVLAANFSRRFNLLPLPDSLSA
jgi:hypothetical protein